MEKVSLNEISNINTIGEITENPGISPVESSLDESSGSLNLNNTMDSSEEIIEHNFGSGFNNNEHNQNQNLFYYNQNDFFFLSFNIEIPASDDEEDVIFNENNGEVLLDNDFLNELGYVESFDSDSDSLSN